MLRHAEQHGNAARMLFVRKSFPGIVDFEQTTREVFGLVYGMPRLLQRRQPHLALSQRRDAPARPAGERQRLRQVSGQELHA